MAERHLLKIPDGIIGDLFFIDRKKYQNKFCKLAN